MGKVRLLSVVNERSDCVAQPSMGLHNDPTNVLANRWL